MTFLLMGIMFVIIGLANKDKWGKPVEVSPEPRKWMIVLVAATVILVALTALARFFL